MKKLTISELNDFFVDTIQRCTNDLLSKTDEVIECEILEEFDIGVISFLHENSLEQLFKNKYINENIKELSLKLREMYLSINEKKRNADSIRKDKQWHNIFKLADTIRKKKKDFDLEKI